MCVGEGGGQADTVEVCDQQHSVMITLNSFKVDVLFSPLVTLGDINC